MEGPGVASYRISGGVTGQLLLHQLRQGTQEDKQQVG